MKKKISWPKALALVALTFVVTVLGFNLFSNGESRVQRKVEHQYAVSDPQFTRSMGVLLGPALVGGNRATTLLNGEQIFPAMLEAIRGAQRTIDFETYIYRTGDTGKRYADSLAELARPG